MNPLFHPALVNDPFGDPALYVEFKYERRALLFDLGDLAPLSTRKLLRISHVFVSHTHMDHFSGFDRLLRVMLGRDKSLVLFGPPGFADRVRHRLHSYTWNLVGNFQTDLVLRAVEVHDEAHGVAVVFRLKQAFRADPQRACSFDRGVLVDEPGFRLRAAVLDHGTPCLAFALEEKQHVNVLKGAVEKQGFRIGPWLRELRRSVLEGAPNDRPFVVRWRENGVTRQRTVPLGELKDRILRMVPGQRIAYVVDAAYHPANAAKIVSLARNADALFIEAAFLDADSEIATNKRHLTARQAGDLAREAGAKRIVPFHFSARYSGLGKRLVEEAEAAFAPCPSRDGTVPSVDQTRAGSSTDETPASTSSSRSRFAVDRR